MPRLRAAVALAAIAALAYPSAAAAHAYLIRSDPADGSSLTDPPRHMRLIFSEQVSPSLSRVRLIGASGRATPARVAGSDRGTVLSVTLPALPRGVYRLEWQTVSTDDLHATRGDVVFGVGNVPVSAAAQRPPDPIPAPGGVLVRWLDFAIIAVLVGSLATVQLVLPAAGRRGLAAVDDLRRRLLVTAAWAALAAVISGIGLLAVQASALSGGVASAAWTLLRDTPYGSHWTVRELLLAALLVAALRLRSQPRSRLARTAVAPLAVALCATLALTGHAAAVRGDLSLATLAMTVHLLAAAAWVGGLVSTVLVAGPLLRRDVHGGRVVLRCFGNMAGVCVALIVITGLYSAGVQVASLDALARSVYGTALLGKTAMFAAAAGLGLINLVLLRRGVGATRLRRTVCLEAVVALAVLIPAAVLTASAPARGPQYAPAAAPRHALGTLYARADDLILRVSVKPNLPGTNFAAVSVLQTRLPEPGPVAGVDVVWPGAGGSATSATRDRRGGVWQLPAHSLARPGAAPLRVVVHRTGVPDAVASLRWTVNDPVRPGVKRPWLSDRPLAPLASQLAGLLALLAAAAALTWFARPFLPRRTPLAATGVRSTD